MSVRAKFKCTENIEGNVRLFPVYSDDPNSENAKFYKWTPSGSIMLNTINESAAEQFVVGEDYYVDFNMATV